jgi:hypothetical protein
MSAPAGAGTLTSRHNVNANIPITEEEATSRGREAAGAPTASAAEDEMADRINFIVAGRRRVARADCDCQVW